MWGGFGEAPCHPSQGLPVPPALAPASCFLPGSRLCPGSLEYHYTSAEWLRFPSQDWAWRWRRVVSHSRGALAPKVFLHALTLQRRRAGGESHRPELLLREGSTWVREAGDGTAPVLGFQAPLRSRMSLCTSTFFLLMWTATHEECQPQHFPIFCKPAPLTERVEISFSATGIKNLQALIKGLWKNSCSNLYDSAETYISSISSYTLV